MKEISISIDRGEGGEEKEKERKEKESVYTEILTREETKKARKEANGYEKMMYMEKTGNDVSTLFTIPLDK